MGTKQTATFEDMPNERNEQTMKSKLTTPFALLAAIAIGGGCNCGGSSADDGDGDGPGDDAGVPSVASSRAKLRFKDGRRLQNDLAQTLGLDSGAVCSELGQYSCVDEIHTVSLLGVEPYGLGFYEPLKETAVTTPIAVERVVVSACSERVERDLSGDDTPLIFAGISNGEIASLEDPAVSAAIETLYKRALARRPTPEEVTHLVGFYSDVLNSGVDNPANQWAKGVCFAVLTTVESLFY